VTTPASPGHGFDPEAEQEVDFAKYGRMLAVRWWLLAAGVVAGAVIGYLVSLGGTEVYSATATIYLGQPYSPTGGTPVNTPQTNPSAVGTIIQQQSVDEVVAHACGLKSPSGFKGGISTQAVPTGASTKGSAAQVNPIVKISVQARKGKVAACAANQLAQAVVSAKYLGKYSAAQIAILQAHIAFDNKDINSIEAAINGGSLDTDGKLILETNLRQDQLDKTTNSGLLLEATSVESPRILTTAASHKITARSRRNTVLIAAIIGLILGALAALLWDRVVPRLTPRDSNGV
jgi:capsular polysaccharide biosynthesis protein